MEIIRNTPASSHNDNPHNSKTSQSSNIFHGITTGKITKITPAAKNENRVNIFIDDEYSFSLGIAQLVDFKLKKGQFLTTEQIAEYKNASEFGKLYQSALEWALSRPRSIKETRDYLKRKQLRRVKEGKKYQYSQEYLHSDTFLELDLEHRKAIREKQPHRPATSVDDSAIEKILTRLIEKGYINDERFAEHYIEYRHQKKGISIKKLRLELAQKGISPNIIDQAFAVIPRDERTEIQKIIAKKSRHYNAPEKLIQYLVRQGFSYELAKTAVHEMDLQNSE